MASLVDTNVLVYRYDPHDPRKRGRAEEILEKGVADGSLVVAHQAVVEFVSVVARPRAGGPPILDPPDAYRHAEMLLQEFEVLYPTDEVLRTALAGAAHHQLPWYDAHMWAYAEVNGVPTILSEDFQHGRIYGRVRIVNPFL